ncbi:hypothetical protein SNE40_018167 [Patella caerulea]|uniref:GRHL1/CP2 C-terminal domain-containing protein n=1 Tax=Patella caerulea TaxID=87958 RepID=A0AAN8J9X9_PATCE
MLKEPTLNCLIQAIEEKYQICRKKIRNLFKKSIKGILVNMDDNIIQHYSHESTFIIEINKNEEQFDVLLIELEPHSLK